MVRCSLACEEKDRMKTKQANDRTPGQYPEWLKQYLASIGAIGGKKSRRKLTAKEARRIAKVRWAAGAGRGAVKACEQSGAGSATHD